MVQPSRKPLPVRSRVAALRKKMRAAGVAAYLVPSTDAHQSEYVPDTWQRRPWLSGFTGSAGDVVVTHDDAGLWTDGRYYLQAGRELRGSGIRLFKAAELATPTPADWLAATLNKGDALGVDPRLLSAAQLESYEKTLAATGARVKLLASNLVDAVWTDRPQAPRGAVSPWPKRFAGDTTAGKLKRLRKELATLGADAHVVTTLDSIAWLFNIRGSDVPYNPVVIAYAIVTGEGAELFVDLAKLDGATARALGKDVVVRPYGEIGAALQGLGRRGAAVVVDPASCNAWVRRRLRGARLVDKPSPIVAMKARKNPTEIAGMKAAHVRDGVAMVRFLCWLAEAVPAGGVTELSAAAKLEAIRSEGEHFRGLSFRTISGYAGHGAIIHYSVDAASDVPLHPKGIYLLDSGGQYLDGTTDITRTLLLGQKATAEQRDRFTRVLQGHIRLARALFPKGVNGVRLDTLARTALWEAGLDYGHGTGHGVGVYLNVHEGPQSISVRGQVPLELGNILSNEPGYYLADAYGIRIENLVLVVEAAVAGEGPFFAFETLTLCPIDTRLVEPALMSEGERRWLNDYHARVRTTLTPLLAPAERRWLAQATRGI